MLSNLKSVEENREYLRSIIGVNERNHIKWESNSLGKEIEYEYYWEENKYSKGILKIRKYENSHVYFEGYEKGIKTGNLIKCILSGILNIIWNKAPWMIDLGMSEEDAKKYTINSSKKIEVKCPYCGKIKKITPNKIYQRHSISCSCGDGVSYPEKLMESVLIQLGIKYERQYRTNWSQNKIYDFYLIDYDTIIEVNGKQHYEESKRFTIRTLKEEQENDKSKEELALKNGIKNYIVIDCSESNLEYIKNNILDSELNELFDLKGINWNKCEEYTLKNKVKEICIYYNEHPGIFTGDLAKEFDIGKTTIISYLKGGTKLGWCKYDSKEEIQRHRKSISKPVSQYFEGEFIKTFHSTMEAERQTGVNHRSISACCNNKLKTAGGYVWRYAE